jgi:hypothetical protein
VRLGEGILLGRCGFDLGPSEKDTEHEREGIALPVTLNATGAVLGFLILSTWATSAEKGPK